MKTIKKSWTKAVYSLVFFIFVFKRVPTPGAIAFNPKACKILKVVATEADKVGIPVSDSIASMADKDGIWTQADAMIASTSFVSSFFLYLKIYQLTIEINKKN